MKTQTTIVGGGLAGSEAAWQAAERGAQVTLFEMRPDCMSEAHQGSHLAELVCSNSLGSALPDRATGLLQQELRLLGSLLMACADKTAVPAGGALAVDREAFAAEVTQRIEAHPHIQVERREVTAIPTGTTIITSGPLTSDRLSKAIAELTGQEQLYFFDAIAPIVHADSINMDVAFRASRYDRGSQEEGDYINCPFTREQYESFIDALLGAERISLRSFDEAVESGVKAGMHHFFEGCLPIEILARRGRDALAFGPMRPVGLIDPRTGRRSHAVLQLRQDNVAGSLYNLVGFQTNLTYPEQERIFRLVPGLDHAEFMRFGQMHRNTFIASPLLLQPTLQTRQRMDLLFAGQIIGVEGYAGNIASGLLAGWNAERVISGSPPVTLPRTTMLGALLHYVTHATVIDFQPMKANFGILPSLTDQKRRGKRERASAYADRAITDLTSVLQSLNESGQSS